MREIDKKAEKIVKAFHAGHLTKTEVNQLINTLQIERLLLEK